MDIVHLDVQITKYIIILTILGCRAYYIKSNTLTNL